MDDEDLYDSDDLDDHDDHEADIDPDDDHGTDSLAEDDSDDDENGYSDIEDELCQTRRPVQRTGDSARRSSQLYLHGVTPMSVGMETPEAARVRREWAVRLFAEEMARRDTLSSPGMLAHELSSEAAANASKETIKTGAMTILMCNAAIYRYEMHSRRPPSALAVQYARIYELSATTWECGPGTEIGALRALFGQADRPVVAGMRSPDDPEYRPPGAMHLLRSNDPCGSYDLIVARLRQEAAAPRANHFLPRDEKADANAVLGREVAARTRRWLSPMRLFSPNEWHRAQWPPVYEPLRHDFEDVEGSMREALNRMLRVLWAYRKYGPQYFSQMLDAMILRAVRARLLARAVSAMMQQARQRSLTDRGSAAFCAMVVNDGGRLGDALWPYLPSEVGHPIMCACRALRDWGRQYSRQLKLQVALHGWPGLSMRATRGVCEPVTADNFPGCGVDDDGTPLVTPSRQLRFRLQFHHTVTASTDLAEESHYYIKHGSAVDKERSAIRASLVLDGKPHKKLPNLPAWPNVSRCDELEDEHGNPLDAYDVFPRGELPRMRHGLTRLSSHFGKRKPLPKLRIRFDVIVATIGKKRTTRYTACTPAFRSVSAVHSDKTKAKRQERDDERQEKLRAHGKEVAELARAGQA